MDDNTPYDPTKRKPLEDNLGMGPLSIAPPMMNGAIGVPPISRPLYATPSAPSSPTSPASPTVDKTPMGGPLTPQNPHAARAEQMEQEGSGVSQVQQKHPFLGGVLRGLDVAGSIINPAITSAIPGTTLHHNALVNREEGLANQDVMRGEKEAQTQEIQQRPAMQQAVMQHQDDLEAQKEAARAALQAQAQKEQQEHLDQTLGQQQDVADQREEAADATRQLNEENANKRFAIAEKNADRRAASAGNVGTWQLHDSGNGQVVEYNNKTGEVRPAPAGIAPKMTADEQRRRDLATNLNENLNQLEDIARRRPELFGPGAGRLTSIRNWAGSSDPDIAALGTLKEMVGQAMLGAHSMRAAQHIEKAADAILNGYKMPADALLKGAIPAARTSLQTFINEKQGTAPQGGTSQPTGGLKITRDANGRIIGVE